MTSEFVMLYKDTSLLSRVGVMELMLFSKNLTATKFALHSTIWL